jgi:hypothetical protein
MAANAFTLARPRGEDLDIPAVPPRKTNTSRAPMDGPIRALDRNGRPTVALPPRVLGSISIQNREDSRASHDRNDAIKRGTSA